MGESRIMYYHNVLTSTLYFVNFFIFVVFFVKLVDKQLQTLCPTGILLPHKITAWVLSFIFGSTIGYSAVIFISYFFCCGLYQYVLCGILVYMERDWLHRVLRAVLSGIPIYTNQTINFNEPLENQNIGQFFNMLLPNANATSRPDESCDRITSANLRQNSNAVIITSGRRIGSGQSEIRVLDQNQNAVSRGVFTTGVNDGLSDAAADPNSHGDEGDGRFQSMCLPNANATSHPDGSCDRNTSANLGQDANAVLFTSGRRTGSGQSENRVLDQSRNRVSIGFVPTGVNAGLPDAAAYPDRHGDTEDDQIDNGPTDTDDQSESGSDNNSPNAVVRPSRRGRRRRAAYTYGRTSIRRRR